MAAATGLPVIPVMTDSGRYWGRRAFRKRPGVIHVILLPPLEPTTRRQDLLPRLEAAWRCGAAAWQGVVDNSVG
jgi:1-acyl-sn-glycerol-3-phosphate acyltransferase